MSSSGSLRRSLIVVAAAGILLSARIVTGADSSRPPSGGVSFTTEYSRLLRTYAAYKGYAEGTVADVETRLAPDRITTLKAIVHAALTNLDPGGPLITLVDQVQGIWGARPGSRDGGHQFRLSVVLKPGARRILDHSRAFRLSVGAHVLMPVPAGGDDDPAFTGFQVDRRGRTWRQIADVPPRLQISLLRSDETVGEIDIDFDEFLCHFRPSNSDPGSLRLKTDHQHLSMLNRRSRSSTDLTGGCHNSSKRSRR